MIIVENTDVWGFEHAIRGMRNPLNSWDKSDSYWEETPTNFYNMVGQRYYIIGENDLSLMRKLYKAGTEHRKYLRQIFVSMDITAPEVWWMQFDTYKINVTSNSESKMHTIHKRDLTMDDFSSDHMSAEGVLHLREWIDIINIARRAYMRYENPVFWNDIIKLLPMSFNQKRTVTMNYENVITIIKQRTGHKLDEWNSFVTILKNLPYIKEIIDD